MMQLPDWSGALNLRVLVQDDGKCVVHDERDRLAGSGRARQEHQVRCTILDVDTSDHRTVLIRNDGAMDEGKLVQQMGLALVDLLKSNARWRGILT